MASSESAARAPLPYLTSLAELEEVVAFLETRKVARFKLPVRLVVLAEYPMTSVGKIN